MQRFEKHSPVVVTEVTTRHELRQFMQYPNRLYADNPNYIPSFYGDDLDDWTPGKNPAFDYCEARCWLARRDGEIVGRIGAILSHKANEKFGTHCMRFSQVDFVDDSEVSAALFGTVERWAREKGCDQVHGPLGFTDCDREGMLVDGFDRRSLFFTNYNAPYYPEHLTRLGYRKDVDWIEYRIAVPEPGGMEAERLHKLSQYILKRKNLHVATLHHKSEYGPYVRQVFELINAAYAPLYGVVELSDAQIERYAKKFIPLVDPEFVCFVLDEQENLVAFGVTTLDPSVALKHSDGRLFPFGWAGVLNDLHHGDTLIMLLTAVRPDLQTEGINAVMMDHVCQNFSGVFLVITHLGTSVRMWKSTDTINLVCHVLLCGSFNSRCHIVNAAYCRNDPDFIAYTNTTVFSAIALEELWLPVWKLCDSFVICISKKISQPCF